MPLIRLTQKLQKEIGFKPADLPTIEKTCEPLMEWYVHLFFLDRRKQLVFVESQTLFSFCIDNVSRKDIRERLPELFEKGLGQALFYEGVSGQVMSKVLETCRNELSFSKTKNRSIVGVMSEFIKQHKLEFLDQDRPFDLQDSVNRNTPTRGFPNSDKYDFPIDVFAKMLKKQFSLNFIPNRKNVFK